MDSMTKEKPKEITMESIKREPSSQPTQNNASENRDSDAHGSQSEPYINEYHIEAREYRSIVLYCRERARSYSVTPKGNL